MKSARNTVVPNWKLATWKKRGENLVYFSFYAECFHSDNDEDLVEVWNITTSQTNQLVLKKMLIGLELPLKKLIPNLQ